MKPRNQLEQLQRNWVTPDGLDRSRPRPVGLTAGGKALLALAVVLGGGSVTAGVLLGSIASRDAQERRMLREEGVDADGQITRLGRDGDRHWVAYRFTVQGRTFQERLKVRARTWRKLREGESLPVRYVASNPELNHPRAWRKGDTPIWLAPLAAVALAAAGWLCTQPVRRQRRLLATGRVSPGLVTRHAKVSHGQAGHGYKIHYDFPLFSGATASGESGPKKDPPPVGSVVCVLYDPEERRRNALYPLSLVRLSHSR